MPEELRRREFVAVAVLTGLDSSRALHAEAQAAKEEPVCGTGDRCPYFDQPLVCEGKKYCER